MGVFITMIYLMIIGGVLLRLIPHLPNFAPISAIAIFGGTYLNKRWAIITPLISVIISDYLLLYINPFNSPAVDFTQIKPITAMFHTTTLYVWASIIVSSFIGRILKKHNQSESVIFASIISSLQFFLITNFGTWAGGMYSRDVTGLLESYFMGLPFFKWTFLGDLFYTVTFFAIYKLAARTEILNSKIFDN